MDAASGLCLCVRRVRPQRAHHVGGSAAADQHAAGAESDHRAVVRLHSGQPVARGQTQLFAAAAASRHPWSSTAPGLFGIALPSH